MPCCTTSLPALLVNSAIWNALGGKPPGASPPSSTLFSGDFMTTATPGLNPATNAYAAKIIGNLTANAKTPEEFQRPLKAYFHVHNYARFHFDIGPSRVKTIQFANYKYVTDDSREQDQLNLVADVPGTFIYTTNDSEVLHQLQEELDKEAKAEIFKVAAASSADRGQQFDPNTPIVPVHVQHGNAPVGLQLHGYQAAGTGMQSSLSGTQAVDVHNAQLTVASQQTMPPIAPSTSNSAAAALARLNTLSAEAGKS